MRSSKRINSRQRDDSTFLTDYLFGQLAGDTMLDLYEQT
jgi:hypothetical protein